MAHDGEVDGPVIAVSVLVNMQEQLGPTKRSMEL